MYSQQRKDTPHVNPWCMHPLAAEAITARGVGVGVFEMKAIHGVNEKKDEFLPPNCTQRTTSEVFD